mmetsp:Transcript_73417/g.129955  ORF Transcript_73417/g.129955 Transcript_73417/m.129955 type:complete len:92 (-) Transcript_73417:233-508(-)
MNNITVAAHKNKSECVILALCSMGGGLHRIPDASIPWVACQGYGRQFYGCEDFSLFARCTHATNSSRIFRLPSFSDACKTCPAHLSIKQNQ